MTGTGAAPDAAPISLRVVERTFGEIRAVDGVSLEVEAGQVVGLLGHNGAGKTTLVRLLTGILAPHGGSVRVFGLDPLTDGPAVRRATGVVSAIPSVDDRLTAWQNLAFVAGVHGIDEATASRRAAALLERFGLAERAEEQVRGYSSGMRQRLALARALLPDPPLVLLDEPTAALDPVASRDVRELIGELAEGRARSVLLCSHNLVEVQRLCDHVVILEQGRVIAAGSPQVLAAELGIGRLRIELARDGLERAERVLSDVGATHEAVDGGVLVTNPASVEVPDLLAALIHAEVRIFAAVPESASLEDVYFALHDRQRS